VTTPGFADDSASGEVLGGSKLDSPAALRLRVAFERSRHAMLIVDDQRRWVTGNTAACDLLGIAREEVPWHAMDDFTIPSERESLDELWQSFLRSGAAEGWYQLYVPDRGAVPVEFSATANVLPARHLSVFIPPEASIESPESALRGEMTWRPVVVEGVDRSQLTEREREVLKLVASGLQSVEISERLFVSPETVKSHVQNAMGKLGARTRAHAVAIALVTGKISWDI
jgi:PAS domain S-box-containing protein